MSFNRLYFLDVGISSFPRLNGRLLSSNLDGSDLQELATGLHMPDGIAVDVENNAIYWTNMGIPSLDDGSIQRSDLDGNNVTTIVPKGITHTPKQLVLARKSRKLYWCDREGMRVMRANADGSNVEVLYQSGAGEEDRKDQMKWCVGIAVDEAAEKVYFTQKGLSKGNKGRILEISLHIKPGETPSTRSDVYTLLDKLPEPIDLELDVESQTLYWTDRGDPPFGNTVNAASLNPTERTADGHLQRRILVRKLHEGIGIAMDKARGKLYFGDLGGEVYSSSIEGGEKTVIHAGMGDVTGVTLS